jgi:hypothetical protein
MMTHGEPGTARGGGRALPASVLAGEAGLAASTASARRSRAVCVSDRGYDGRREMFGVELEAAATTSG